MMALETPRINVSMKFLDLSRARRVLSSIAWERRRRGIGIVVVLPNSRG